MRSSNRGSAAKGASRAATMAAPDAYRASGLLIRKRLLQAETIINSRGDELLQAEALALQVRKVIESVAFLALSAAEYRNKATLGEMRTKDADKLLALLQTRKMLKLPEAQDILTPSDPAYTMEVRGAQSRNLDLSFLKGAYSRASELVHERHPDRLEQAAVASDFRQLSADSLALQKWLWTHTMFFQGEIILVRMAYPDAQRFITELRGPQAAEPVIQGAGPV